mmetsp:Transcript_24712/g.54647  ORF Transcript_24712/g.54647 Transcript_24712/m.54647 type:complete len:289 (-) Transcript_24712:732-1598(-)
MISSSRSLLKVQQHQIGVAYRRHQPTRPRPGPRSGGSPPVRDLPPRADPPRCCRHPRRLHRHLTPQPAPTSISAIRSGACLYHQTWSGWRLPPTYLNCWYFPHVDLARRREISWLHLDSDRDIGAVASVLPRDCCCCCCCCVLILMLLKLMLLLPVVVAALTHQKLMLTLLLMTMLIIMTMMTKQSQALDRTWQREWTSTAAVDRYPAAGHLHLHFSLLFFRYHQHHQHLQPLLARWKIQDPAQWEREAPSSTIFRCSAPSSSCCRSSCRRYHRHRRRRKDRSRQPLP